MGSRARVPSAGLPWGFWGWEFLELAAVELVGGGRVVVGLLEGPVSSPGSL